MEQPRVYNILYKVTTCEPEQAAFCVAHHVSGTFLVKGDNHATQECFFRTRIMLVDISIWEKAAQAHGEVFSEIRPACTFVEISGLINSDWLVETEADCVLNAG